MIASALSCKVDRRLFISLSINLDVMKKNNPQSAQAEVQISRMAVPRGKGFPEARRASEMIPVRSGARAAPLDSMKY